jgi:hypothetical protein
VSLKFEPPSAWDLLIQHDAIEAQIFDDAELKKAGDAARTPAGARHGPGLSRLARAQATGRQLLGVAVPLPLRRGGRRPQDDPALPVATPVRRATVHVGHHAVWRQVRGAGQDRGWAMQPEWAENGHRHAEWEPPPDWESSTPPRPRLTVVPRPKDGTP